MKSTLIHLLWLAVLAGLFGAAVAQQPPPPPTPLDFEQMAVEAVAAILSATNVPPQAVGGSPPLSNPPPPTVSAPPSAVRAPASAPTATTNVAAAPAEPVPLPEPPLVMLNENEMRLNFRNAPLELVLSHFSQAAGFIIELQTPVRGTVDVYSATPVTKEEAVDLLNSMLNKNGYAAIRNGRRLTIVNKTEAVRRDIPVKTGNDPAAIPKNDELITQIIPIRFVEATQLAKDLAPMVSPQALIVANEAGNSIAITDTQANIRHLVEIIKAIDTSAEDETQVRVFALKHADPIEMADLLTNLFPDQSGSAQAPIRFGGRSGSSGFSSSPFGSMLAAISGRFPPPPPGMGSSGQQQRVRKRAQVVAVPDARTSSVVVTAARDLMEQIAEVIQQLDVESPKESKVQVFHLNNADPNEVLPVLQDMFQNTTSGRGARGSTQDSALMNRQRQTQTQSSTSPTSSRIGTGLGGGRGISGSTF